jgi:hypothetical protein
MRASMRVVEKRSLVSLQVGREIPASFFRNPRLRCACQPWSNAIPSWLSYSSTWPTETRVNLPRVASVFATATANIFQKNSGRSLVSWGAAAGHRFGFFYQCALSPSKAPSSRSTPGHPHCKKTSWATAELGQSPTFRAFASSRETPSPSA